MKYFLSLLVIGGMFIGCSKEEPDIPHADLVITIMSSEGANIVDNPDYDASSFQKLDINGISVTLENFKDCEPLFVIPLGTPDPWYIDFGNGDIDTITYKWEDNSSASGPDITKLDWLEVYYNNNLARRMEFNSGEERSILIRSNCNVPTCPTDCSSPDVIEIIKD